MRDPVLENIMQCYVPYKDNMTFVLTRHSEHYRDLLVEWGIWEIFFLKLNTNT
jgi:hypothetical protein